MARVQKAWNIERIWREHESAFVLLVPVSGQEGEPDDEVKQMLEATGLTVESCVNWEEDLKRPWRLLMFGGVQFYGVLPGSAYDDEAAAFAPGTNCVRQPNKPLFRAAVEGVMVDTQMKDALKAVHVVGLDGCAEILYIGNAVDNTLKHREIPDADFVSGMAEHAFMSVKAGRKAAAKDAPAKKKPAAEAKKPTPKPRKPAARKRGR